MRMYVYILMMFGCYVKNANGQNTVQITANSVITQGRDNLVITCSGSGSLQAITSYSIYKNSSTGVKSEIVKRAYNIITSQLSTTWRDDDLQTRGNLSGSPMPQPTATLVLIIPKDRVRCPQDAVEYQCRFLAQPNTNGAPVTLISDYKNVDIQAEPTSMGPIMISAQYNGQNVPTQDSTGRHVFNVGTTLTFSCTGMIGNPQRTPRWCYKKTSDFTWLAPATGVTNDPATMSGCGYQMTTTLVYNVSNSDDSVMFMCEAGDNPLCGFGDVKSNKTIFLAQTTNTGGQGGGDTGIGGGAIAGIVIGCIAVLVIVALLVYFLVFRNQPDKTKETDLGHNGMTENSREGPVYSVPHKEKSDRGGRRNRGDRYVSENPALDVPHEDKPRYLNNDGGQYNRGMYDSQDDVKLRQPYEEDVRRSMQDLPMGSAV